MSSHRMGRFGTLAAGLALVVGCTNPPPAPTPTQATQPPPTPTASPSGAPSSEPTGTPSADGPGPKVVTGQVTYTNTFFTAGVAQPLVLLEDQAGFVDRNRQFVIPVESQVLGQITTDFYTSPFSYSLTLPAEPKGSLRDVDHDDAAEAGVMVFAVAYWTNVWGDPYLERRDQGGGGWSTAYASTEVSRDRATYREVIGGKLLVFAPDGNQDFPTDFGPDGKLFTDDDPVGPLEAGWSVVDLEQSPFFLDRSENPDIDLIEPESAALDDFSGLGYAAAFDAMLDKFSTEYAFTEFKNIDWAAKGAQFRPRFEAAENSGDAHAYALALRDFIWSIPDAHVGMDTTPLGADFQADTINGLGMAMTETDDGKFIVTFLSPGGPAQNAGMQLGAEITVLDGQPTDAVVDANVPWESPFSNPVVERLQQVRYATRFPANQPTAEVGWTNPGAAPQSATITLGREYDSLIASSLVEEASPTALPVEFEVLPEGIGYIAINSFLDNDVLSIQVWERALRYFNENNVPAAIIDMRHNGGGNGWLATQMAAYFFNAETDIGFSEFYDPSTGEFYADPGEFRSMIPPPPELQFFGPVVVLVGPGCASACEFFSHALTTNDRATIVGEYATAGAGGSVEQFLMPEAISVQFTIGRAKDVNGNIHIEGGGVVPDVDLPVTSQTLADEAAGADVILRAAIDYMQGP